MKKLQNIRCSRKTFHLIVAGFFLLRLLLTSQQHITAYPEITLIDDMLMFRAAQSVSAGMWLGPYSFLAIAKHMFFSLWLALIHQIGISYVLAGNILSLLACAAAFGAVAQFLKNDIIKLFLLASLLFCPALYADYTLRVYRDNITTSFVIMVFAGVMGMALRWKEKKTLGFWLYAVLGGFSLGISYLLREDGYWLFPFFGVGLIVLLYYLWRKGGEKKAQKMLAIGVSIALAAGSVASYAAMNEQYYGRRVVSDFTSPEFQAAYGAITRIQRSENDNPIVPVDAASRQKLYAASPAFAELEPFLEDVTASTAWMRKDCGVGVFEYSGGGLYWAIRMAASEQGYYADAQAAAAYYRRVADELNAAYDSGQLQAATGERSALNTPLTAEYILPTLGEVARSVWFVTTYQDIACDPALSEGSRALINAISAYCRTDALTMNVIPADGTRIVIWAVSETNPVTVELQTSDGVSLEGVSYMPSAGSDVFLKFLDKGLTLYYADGGRMILTLSSTAAEDIMIKMACGGEVIAVPAAAMEKPAHSGEIYYQVEYVGSNFSEEKQGATYGTGELWLYRATRLIVWMYRVFSPILLGAALFVLVRTLCKKIGKGKERSTQEDHVILWIIVGIGLSCLLRFGMVAFVEVSAFGIGTNPMYLSAVYPLGILFSVLSIAQWRGKRIESEDHRAENV